MKIFLRRTCREAAYLTTSRRDRELALADRVALRLHLMACKACPRFERQIKLMDSAMGSWRGYVEGDGRL
ncbi:zf-HC2 domain-containing protein [uncultured Methylibium sp.]|uniref:zf-HC2 domain-containing protein n=1 Tax=uncultured Methylibium sp. TaxID=381093 RepID=UPI0025DCDF75|nr:zf-HC2 domain-containing protein [uncultured Methylibium sp.]